MCRRSLFFIFICVLAVLALRRVSRNSVVSRPISASAIATATTATESDAAVALRTLDHNASQPTQPWIVDFAEFASAHPGQWVIGRCRQPCLSQAEADRMAHDDATHGLLAALQNQTPAGRGADLMWRLQKLSADVRAGELDSGRLVEKFNRPYGTVWTETVLLDLSPERLQPLLAGYDAAWARHQIGVGILRTGAIFALVGFWVLCLLANVLTRGYFAGRLRAVRFVALLAVLALWI